MIVLATSAGVYGLALHGQVQSSTLVLTPTASYPKITPTLDAKAALLTDDFNKFYEAFSTLLGDGEYATLQTASDTENFQVIPLRADPPFATWQPFYTALLDGSLVLNLPDVPFAPDAAGYACFGYGPTGIDYIGLSIPAQRLTYAVGTAFDSTVSPDDVRNTLNGTVFVFELPEEPSATWLWRAVTFNNALGCG